MTLSIRARIVLIAVVIVLFAIGASTLTSSYLFSREYSKALHMRALSEAQGLKLQLDRLLQLGIPITELVGFEEQCQAVVRRHSDISYAVVVDKRGETLFSSHAPDEHSGSSNSRPGNGPGDASAFATGGEDYYEAVVPVLNRSGGDQIGEIKVAFARELVARKTTALFTSSIAAGVVVLALAVALLIFAITIWVTKPLRKLVGVIHDISKGGADANRRVEVSSRDELGQLGTAFNEMIGELHASHADIQRHAERLESKVEERTRELRKATDTAEAANRSKSQFLANMSHEIRTPMTAILGFADILLEHGDSGGASPERIDAARTIKKNGEYLISIINDILDLSKVEAGKMGVEQITCSPCGLIADVASLVRVKTDGKNLSFDVEYIGAVPETIQTDPTRLRQILINLIGNAIKFTETGGVRLITSFVEDKDKPVMQFDVLDTGIGLTEEQVAKLFQPFTQADASTTRKFGGTGLGLTISKRFAELLGGDITIADTQEGVGTRFRLTVTAGSLDKVKMLDDPLSATVVTTEAPASATDEPGLQDCRILLAEDGPDNQRLIAHFLKQAGAEVTIRENGKLAAEASLAARDEGHPFDMILMDMQMPVMDGYEAATFLRRKGYTGPIIALTAHAMASDRQKCLDAGCDDYASKPINRRKLIATIQKRRRKGPIPEKELATLTNAHETASR